MRNTINNFVFGNRYNWSDPFTIVIDTRNISTGSSAANQFLYPQDPNALDGYIDFLVDWGDGEFSRIQNKADARIPHTYQVPGIYVLNFYKPKGKTIYISPRYENNEAERLKLIKVLRWGSFDITRGSFWGCVNLDLSQVEGDFSTYRTCESLFRGAGSQTIKTLDTMQFRGGTVSSVFAGMPEFNQQFIFNLPNATVLLATFIECTKFNSKINFIAPNLTSLTRVFEGCSLFNQDISTWFDWTKITNLTDIMRRKSSANYNPQYYDNLLIALDAGGQTNVPLGMGSIKHTSVGSSAKNNLLAKGWTITDGGMI